jgi:hypothetical protein
MIAQPMIVQSARAVSRRQLSNRPPRAIHAESPGFSAAAHRDFTQSCSQIGHFHDDPSVECSGAGDFNAKHHETPPFVTRRLRF